MTDLLLPLAGALSVTLTGLVAWRMLSQDDDTTRAMKEAERKRTQQQEDRLRSFYDTGDLPAGRMSDLARGADVRRSDDDGLLVTKTPYSDLAARYGFETYKYYHRGEIVLVDTQLQQMDIKKRLYCYPMHKVVRANQETLKKLMRTARINVNRRAQRAGLLPVRERRGNPGKPAAIGGGA